MNHASRTRRRFPWIGVVLAALLALSLATPAAATAVFTVDSVLDEVDDNPGNGFCHTAAGTCTLRAALMEANPIVGQDSIIIVPAGTYPLTIAPSAGGLADGPLKLAPPASGSPSISIVGAGAGATIIDAGAALRAFTIQRIATIVGVTIRNGMSKAPLPGEGGAIANIGVGGVLTLSDCSLENNQALGNGALPGRGGAIYNTGIVTIERCTIKGNSSSAEGGAIFNYSNSTIDIRHSTLSGNQSQTTGGGVENLGTLYATDSTISANLAGFQSGGIDNLGTANIYSTTIAFNQTAVNGGSANGGGVYNAPGAVLNLRNSVLAGNSRPTPFAYDDCGGDVGSYGNNFFFAIPAGCSVTQKNSGAVMSVTALSELGPLQNNGGPTLTHALLPPSTMIDGADPVAGCVDANSAAIAVDQRGLPRTFGTSCDVGAFEYTDLLFANSFEPPPLVINEVDYDQVSTDDAEFIEIRNNSTRPVDLTGKALVLVNGANNSEYLRIDLGSAGALPGGGYLVVHSPNVGVAPGALSLLFPGTIDQIQNGAPDGIALIQVSPPVLLDALSYEGSITAATITGFPLPVNLVEGTALGVVTADSNTTTGSLVRLPDGSDSNDANTDWRFSTTPTPGAANQ